VNIRTVQELLGHRSIETTMVYLKEIPLGYACDEQEKFGDKKSGG